MTTKTLGFSLFLKWAAKEIYRATFFYAALWPLLYMVIPRWLNEAFPDAKLKITTYSFEVYVMMGLFALFMVVYRLKPTFIFLGNCFTAYAAYNGSLDKIEGRPNTDSSSYNLVVEMKRYYSVLIHFLVASYLAFVTLDTGFNDIIMKDRVDYLYSQCTNQ